MSRQRDFPCVLPVSRFSFLSFQPTGRKQRTGSLRYLQSTRRRKEMDAALRWHVTALDFRKKEVCDFIRNLCKGILLILELQLIHQKFIFHINAVPWLYTLSRHCTVCAGIDFTLMESLWRVSHKEIRRWLTLCCNELHLWCIRMKTCVLFLPCAFWLYLHAVLQSDPHLACQCKSSWKLLLVQAQAQVSAPYQPARPKLLPYSLHSAQSASRANLYLPEKGHVDNLSEPLKVKFGLVGHVGTL